MTRLYELAPDEGRRLILEEIRTGAHAIRYDTLAALPDASLPELDAALEARYSSARPPAMRLQDHGTTAWLMARYGSPRLLPFVTGLIARAMQGCDVEGALIAYLLKHDPSAAMKRLDPGFDRTARNTCVAPLPSVAAHYWDAGVESAAIAQLRSDDVRQVMDAAQVLGSHGSNAAKQPLLDRLTKWSAEWRARAAEWVPAGPSKSVSSELIENSVVNALFRDKRIELTKDEAAT